MRFQALQAGRALTESALCASSSTPPRLQRHDMAQNALDVLSDLEESSLHVLESSDMISVSAANQAWALGTYASRDVLLGMIEHDVPSPHEIEQAALTIGELCTRLTASNAIERCRHGSLGIIAEVGFVNMMLNGIATGEINARYATLYGPPKNRIPLPSGLRSDVDAYTTLTRDVGQQRRLPVQLKLSARTATNTMGLYQPHIKVLGLQSLFEGDTTTAKAVQLLFDHDPLGRNDHHYSAIHEKINTEFWARPKSQPASPLWNPAQRYRAVV